MSKRAYGSAFCASPPNGTRAAANGFGTPQPQQHLCSSPSSLRIPGQWPDEHGFASVNDQPLRDTISIFTTMASAAFATFLTLPRRLVQRFLRRRNIAAVPVVREDGSNKKRLVDLGFADEPATHSPSAKARANLTRRHARQPATTLSSGFSYPSPESNSSSSPSLSYEEPSMDVQMTQPVGGGADEDDSIGFSFADVWTSPVPKKSPSDCPTQKSEDHPQNQSPTSKLSPTPASKFNNPPLPTLNTSPVPRRPIPGLRPCYLPRIDEKKLKELSRRKPIHYPGGSGIFPPLDLDQILKNRKRSRQIPPDFMRLDRPALPPAMRVKEHPFPFVWGRRPSPKNIPPKIELPKLGTDGRPAPPKKMIPQTPIPMKPTPAWRPPVRSRLGQPLVIDPKRSLGPLCPTTLRKKKPYYVAPLPRAIASSKNPYAQKTPSQVMGQGMFTSVALHPRSAAITPMRRRLLEVLFNTQASQEQHFSGPGIGLLNPTHPDGPAAPPSLPTDVLSSYFETSVPSSSFGTNVPSFSFGGHVEPSTSHSQVPLEDSFVYENDLSFLADAPLPSPKPRKTVTWNTTLEEKEFYCDENVNKMMQSIFQNESGPNTTKAPDADEKEHKELKQDSSCQPQEFEDASSDDESGLSAAIENALEDDDASHDSLFDEGSNISQLDDINDQSLEESEISMELLEEVRKKVEKNLTLVPPPAPAVKPLVSPLNAEEDDALEAVAEKASRSEKPDAHVVCKKLSLRDFGTLLPTMFNGSPRAWLNDNIVNEYLAILVNHKKKEAGFEHKSSGPAPPVHAFVSFWYQSQPSSIARWAGKVQLGGSQYLDADLILYPICDNGHWRLLAVKPKERIIEYLDSLGYPGKKYVTKFKEYIQKQLGTEWVEDEWTVVELQNSTQQLNGSDCGVFTLLNALVLLRGEEPKRVLADYGMEDARRRIATTLLAGQPTTEWA